MIKELVILVGPVGAGKTTYCHERLPNHVRVSQDEMGRYGHRDVFTKLIQDGAPNIVVDRMNFNRKQRWRYLKPARAAGYKIKIIDFKPLKTEVLWKRVLDRKGHPTLGEQTPSEKVIEILQFYLSSYQAPKEDEYDELEVI